MILNSGKQDHSLLERLIQERRKQAFQWPFSQATEAVQPVEEKPEGDIPVPPGPSMEPPPMPAPKGSTKNIANRMLAEGLDLPEQAGSNPVPEGNPLTSGVVGGHQSRLLSKRKNQEANAPSALGGMKL